MDGLSVLSPASRERSLDDLPRKELQQLAKEAGVKGNIKSKDIVQSLLRCLEGQEAVPGTVQKAHPATSTEPLAHADTTGSIEAETSLSDHAKQLDDAMDAAAQQQPESSLVQDQPELAASAKGFADDRRASSGIQQPPAPEDDPAAEDLAHTTELQPDHKSNRDAAANATDADDEGCKVSKEQQQADTQPSANSSVPAQSPAMTATAASANPDVSDVTEQTQSRPASASPAGTELASTPDVAAEDPGRVSPAAQPASEPARNAASTAAEATPDAANTASEAASDATNAAAVGAVNGAASTATVAASDNANAAAEVAVDGTASEAASDAADAAAEVGGDCVSNPLYEEPEDLRPVPQAAVQPSLLSQDLQRSQKAAAAAEAGEDAVGPATGPQMKQQEVSSSCDQDVKMACADMTAAPQQLLDSQPVHASEAQSQQHSSLAVHQGPQDGSMHDVVMSEAEEEQHGREPTPENLANLGKAVELVQAQSCHLSPSLLTVGQVPPGLDSPARDAFERGRKSGIWQGSTEVELRQLECQWDDYKSVATRGWDLPNLQEVQAKSDALEASGFATVHSPMVSQATRQAMAKQVSKGGKRKARGEEGEEGAAGSKQAGPSRKAVKRAQGHTPSRKAPAHSHKGNSPAPQSHGTPLRHMNGTRAPSRLANSTHAADLENAAKAASSTPAAQTGEGKVQSSPFCAGITNKDTSAGARASKATGIPKPRPANDRAKKAEATFAARRAAALAKVRK